jgi:peptidoglycan/LPS O-acetylase OafA/YrhL
LVLRLSDYAISRDNNFNLIRFLAALSVVWYHSGPILGLQPSPAFIIDHLGLSLGDIAIDVFFITSGFLVTGSLFNRGSLIAFLWARALRIYPALWVMLVLTGIVLAPAMTSLSLPSYFASPTTYEYFARCGTLIAGVRWSLPGVFKTLPLKDQFNMSLWTLPVELRLYLFLAAGWLVFAVTPRIRISALASLAPLASALFLVIIVRGRVFGASFNVGDIRVFMFLYGSTLYMWRDKVPLGPETLAAAFACLLFAAFDKSVFFVAYLLCLAPIIMHLAYIPRGVIRSFNNWGDFSYGVYIYAFPIQQTIAFLFPKMSLLAMAGFSSLLSIAVAALSWFLVEKPALAHKDDVAAATSRALNLGLAKITA